MKKIIILLYSFVLISISHAQGPGQPYFPETANGAKYIHSTGHRLLWQNPDSTVFNIIYFSEDSNLVAQMDTSSILYDGTPSSVYDTIYLTTVDPLDWSKNYYWRIVEYYSSGLMEGPVWSFKTMHYPFCEYEVFFDDFEDTSFTNQNWTITNDGGTCVWEQFFPPHTNNYTLPLSSSGGVLAADADECGSGTTLLSTAYTPVMDATSNCCVSLEFDNDWNAISSSDTATVEITIDGGVTWSTVFAWNGTDVRNTHEIHYISSAAHHMFQLRFRSVQPGWEWWWAIDNVRIDLDCYLTQFYPPHNLILNTISQPKPKVELNWSRGQFADYFHIYRKIGLPNDSTAYSYIGSTNPNVTTFIDTTVDKNHIYTYWVVHINQGKSNEATAYVPEVIPVELTSFTASVSGNDVHLNWNTATELNNSGFDIEKRQTSDVKRDNIWNEIGFVPGHGTITEPQFYSFVDKSVSSGKYKYRLKQIDYDGTFEYSDIVEVEVALPTEFSLEQNYPNPFNPTTKIKYTIPTLPTGQAGSPQSPSYQGGEAKLGLFVQLKVYDVLGNEIATLVNEEKLAGSYEVEFSVGQNSILSLSSGVYFYILQAGIFIETKKMILMK